MNERKASQLENDEESGWALSIPLPGYEPWTYKTASHCATNSAKMTRGQFIKKTFYHLEWWGKQIFNAIPANKKIPVKTFSAKAG